MQENIKKIGILLVHGIGDQQRHEHVNSVARHFVDMSCLKYGDGNVSVTAHPGYKGRAPVTLSIAENDGEAPNVQIDFHEVWWRDLGDTRTFGRIIKFWFWALSISGTRGQFSNPTAEHDLPTNPSSIRKRVGIGSRIKLFYTTTFFFVMLAPLWLLTNIANIIPGLPRIRLFDSVFAYMSSVKLYQNLGDNLAGRIDDFNQPRRLSIQRKVHEALVHLYRQNYDRWYIAGHSLGSVIAFKALFSCEHGFARLLTRNVWEFEVDEKLKYSCPPPAPYPDEPKRPNWMSNDSAIRTDLLLSKCAGFVSWGSPLETFAHAWPATIPMSKAFAVTTDFQWLNIYDAADIVASPLSSFKITTADSNEVEPINISTRSHSFIAFSHTHYFHTKNLDDAKNRVGFSILEWLIGDQRNFHECAKKVGFRLNSSTKEDRRRFSIAIQCFVALFIGIVLWPRAMALILNIIRKIIVLIISLVDGAASNEFDRATEFIEEKLQDPAVLLNFKLDIQIILWTALFLLACAFIHFVIEAARSLRNERSAKD
jgi:hypothetical protein